MIRLFIVLAMVFSFSVPCAWAQSALMIDEGAAPRQHSHGDMTKRFGETQEGAEDEVPSDSSGISVRFEDLPPIEPDIPPVIYLKIKPPSSLQERVERLMHGLYVIIPPEYDHYGYEMRRYMARIAGPTVLGNKQAMIDQINNIKNARIVLKYWREYLDDEMMAIESELDNEGAGSSVRSLYKYNRGSVYAFLTEANQWLKHNEDILQFLVDKHGTYVYKDPDIYFTNLQDRIKFLAILKAKEDARKQMVEYAPFRGMIY